MTFSNEVDMSASTPGSVSVSGFGFVALDADSTVKAVSVGATANRGFGGAGNVDATSLDFTSGNLSGAGSLTVSGPTSFTTSGFKSVSYFNTGYDLILDGPTTLDACNGWIGGGVATIESNSQFDITGDITIAGNGIFVNNNILNINPQPQSPSTPTSTTPPPAPSTSQTTPPSTSTAVLSTTALLQSRASAS